MLLTSHVEHFRPRAEDNSPALGSLAQCNSSLCMVQSNKNSILCGCVCVPVLVYVLFCMHLCRCVCVCMCVCARLFALESASIHLKYHCVAETEMSFASF